jgi:putative spermidine/putrescine transport system permease protein
VALTDLATPAPVAGTTPATGTGRRTSWGDLLPLLPFLSFLTVFLIVPTVTVALGAFRAADGGFTLGNVRALGSEAAIQALWKSILLSGTSALLGAVLGALLSYLILSMGERSILRRATLSVCGVLAQFGGVTLAFAFVSLLAINGVLTQAVQSSIGIDIYGSGWLFGLNGLIVVYTYFQIPLMVIVFTPALAALRPQWRESAVNLGATTWQYWRQVAVPLLTPAFLGSMLLLFANAFAAYATAAVLVSQGNPIIPLFIRSALTSEVLLGQANLGFALALEMIIVVSVVMTLYAVLLRRTSRWMR